MVMNCIRSYSTVLYVWPNFKQGTTPSFCPHSVSQSDFLRITPPTKRQKYFALSARVPSFERDRPRPPLVTPQLNWGPARRAVNYTPGRDGTRNAARRPGPGGRPRGCGFEEQGGACTRIKYHGMALCSRDGFCVCVCVNCVCVNIIRHY